MQILSQISDPKPGIKVSTVFARSFPKNGVLEVISFEPGSTYRVILGIENYGNESIILTDLAGALVDVQLIKPNEPPVFKYVQNFTVEPLNGKRVRPGQVVTIAYDFLPFTSLKTPSPYTL